MEDSIDPELDAMGKVFGALKPLDDNARDRVMGWVNEKLGRKDAQQKPIEPKVTGTGAEGSALPNTHHQKVAAWLKQNELSEEDLSEAVHVSGAEATVIASDIPGDSDREKTMNAYLLAGVAQFLVSGEPNFTDEAGRQLCVSGGFFDASNHTKYIKGNELAGAKGTGWSLTKPGLKRAASVIKGLKGD